MTEHKHCRDAAALFDVSHMGQIKLVGADAAAALESLVPMDIVDLAAGRQRYAFFTNVVGGLQDDLMAAIGTPPPAAGGGPVFSPFPSSPAPAASAAATTPDEPARVYGAAAWQSAQQRHAVGSARDARARNTHRYRRGAAGGSATEAQTARRKQTRQCGPAEARARDEGRAQVQWRPGGKRKNRTRRESFSTGCG
jgi:hypothetical protein